MKLIDRAKRFTAVAVASVVLITSPTAPVYAQDDASVSSPSSVATDNAATENAATAAEGDVAPAAPNPAPAEAEVPASAPDPAPAEEDAPPAAPNRAPAEEDAPAEETQESREAKSGFAIEETAEGGVIITGLGGITLNDGALTIPAEVDGKKVVGIGERAFRNAGVRTLSFADGLELNSIGDGAFQGNGITGALKVPAKQIGENAFAQNKIKNLELSGTTAVGKDAFRDNQIESLKLAPRAGETVAIAERAFVNNRLKGTVDLTKTGAIGNDAFATNNLREAKVGENTTLGSDVFKENRAWVKLTTPESAQVDGSIVTAEYESGFGQIVDPVKVVVRYVDENGEQILPDETLGDDLTAPGPKFQRGKEATHTPRQVSGYKLDTESITFTPDKDGFVIEAKYTKVDNKPVFTFPEGGIKLDNGEKVTPERVKRGVTAKAKDGTDLTKDITVDVSSINSKSPGMYEAVFSVKDKDGNETVETRPVAVGVNWGEYEFGGGWQIKDFEYKFAAGKSSIVGFSDSGKKKLEAGNTALWLPPFDLQGRPNTNVGRQAFKNKNITSIEGDWGNISEIEYEAFRDNKNLATLPDSWGNVKVIGGNAFYESGLTSLPESWGNVEVVSWWAFYRNKLTELPKSWGNISKIANYSFMENKISVLPPSWGSVTDIGDGAFQDNGIESIPESWGHVKRINRDAFRRNRIESLPETWGVVTSIDHNSFANNRIESLPETWGLVDWIGSGTFEQNRIVTLPDSWGKVSFIGGSAFAENKITALPESWGKISSISYGVFSGNQLTSLPKSWENITSIGSQAFKSNQIAEIPDSWGEITKIDSEAFSSNKIVTIPDSWGKVKELGRYTFSKNQIEILPDSWGELTKIPYGVFLTNNISQIPGDWGKITEIDEWAFHQNSLAALPENWGQITAIKQSAFYKNAICVLPASWGNVKHVGATAFYTEECSISNVEFEMPKENLTQEFVDSLLKSSLKAPIRIFTEDRITPPGLKLPEGVKVNPTKVTIRYVDEHGNPIGPKVQSIDGQMGSKFTYEPPAIFGYKAPPAVTKVLENIPEHEIVLTYQRAPIESDTTVTLTLRNKDPYLIGNDMSGNIRVDRTGYDTNTLNNVRVRVDLDPEIYDLSTFNITTGQLGIDKNSIRREGGSVSFVLPTLGPTDTKTIPFRVKFRSGPTASNTDYPLVATVVREDNVAIAESKVESFRGYYPSPNSSISVAGEARDGLISNYTQPVAKDDSGNPVSFVADNNPGEDVKNTLSYNICVRGLERNIANYALTVPLPRYLVHQKSATFDPQNPQRLAEFDPANNPGWELSEDGITLVFKGNNNDSTAPFCAPLKLGYPGAVEGERFAVQSTAKMTPSNQPPGEPDLITTANHSNYFGRFTPPPGKTLVKYPTGNHGSIYNNYFYDNAHERSGTFPWMIGFEAQETLQNVVIRDFGLDERMYYDSVSLPENLGLGTLRVLDAEGVELQTVELGENSSRTVKLDKHKVITATELRFEAKNPLAKGTRGSVEVLARLKDPEPPVLGASVEENDAKKIFRNSASIEGNGKVIAEATAQKTARPHSQQLRAFKSQTLLGEDGMPTTALITGDRIDYSVGFTLSEGFGETITNIEVIDLLPKDIDIISVSMASEFSRLPGAHYEVIENYRDSGHTAVIFKASSASREHVGGTYGARVQAGTIKASINMGLKSTDLVNDAFAKANNIELLNKGRDKRLGDEEWSSAQVETTFEPGAAMEATKQIRSYGADDKPGVWRASETTVPGAKLDYRMRLTNGTDRERENLIVYDVFPHVGDQGIPSARQSDFENKWDVSRAVTLPDGYSISYYNGDAWPIYDGTRTQTDEVLSGLQWDDQPSEATKAVRIVQNPEVKLGAKSQIEFVLPFRANAERVDAFGNPPADLLGKWAYNTYFFKDSMQPELLEGNRVQNQIMARPITIAFKKVKHGSKNEALAGATFALKNRAGDTVATATSQKDGMIRFRNATVLPGYKVVEISAPAGFSLSKEERVITENDLRAGFSKNPAVIEMADFSNQRTPEPPVYGRVEFKKTTLDGKPLPGTRFKLSAGSDAYFATAGKDGKVVFVNVIPQKNYTLSEVQPVAPFAPIQPRTVFVEPKGTTYVGEKHHGQDHVIVNDKVQIQLSKIGVTDDRLYHADGSPRQFGSFGAIDGQLIKAQFELLDLESNEVIAKPYPWYNPTTLERLTPGKLYKLRETEPDRGYEKIPHLENDLIFQVSTDGRLLNKKGEPFPIQSGLYVPNRSSTQLSKVTVKKVDQKSNPLAKGVFVLERNEEVDGQQTWEQVGEPVTTGDDGVAAFTELEQGRYRVVETQNPAGYVGDYVSPEFVVQRTVAKTFTYTAMNYRIRPTVAKIDYVARGLPDQATALKVSKDNPDSVVIRRSGAWEVVKYLPGAKFDLHEDSKDGKVVQSIETGKDGKAPITVDLDPAKSYVLVETQAPEGYAAPEVPVTFNPETLMQFEPGREKGMFTVYAPNARETGRIVVSKTDQDSGLPLLDGRAEFTAQKVSRVTDGSEGDDDIVIEDVRYRPDPKEKVHTKKTSKSSGVATFDKLSHGTWIVRETAAAKDFEVDDAPAIFEVNKQESSHTLVFANQGDPKIKLTKFINGYDANNKLTAVWLPHQTDTMDVKFVVENTGKATLRDVTVTDRIEDAEDQYINEALEHAVFTVTRADGTVENHVLNSMMVLQPGDKAETTLEGMAAPDVNKLHRNDATVVGTWRSPNDVTDADPAHAYRIPVPLPLPSTGDAPWLVRLLVFGGLSLVAGLFFANRSVRRKDD